MDLETGGSQDFPIRTIETMTIDNSENCLCPPCSKIMSSELFQEQKKEKKNSLM